MRFTTPVLVQLPKNKCVLVVIFSLMLQFFNADVKGQSDSTKQKLAQSFNSINVKSFNTIENKYTKLERQLDNKTEKLLHVMQKKEARLEEKMNRKDSTKSQQLFSNVQMQYQQLSTKFKSNSNANIISSYREYIPGIDSMQTAMKFLSQGGSLSAIPSVKLQQVQTISQKIQQLQGKIQSANEIQDYVRQREQFLQVQLAQYGLGKQLLGMNKQIYYYQSQLAEYKSMLNDKEKAEQAVLGAVRQLPAFQNFWQKYSLLAQLFPMPANYGSAQALTSLQTKASIQNVIQKAGGSVGENSNSSNIQQEVQQAQTFLNQLKDKVTSLSGTSGSGEMTMPDFQPNSQHIKSFMNRLEYSLNIQNAQSTGVLPTTSTVALTVGYKLSDNAVAGIGVSYILGWGNGLNHISLSNQGIGFRSFIDVKAKGSIWLTSGFDYTYYQQFYKLRDLKNIDVWQKSALVGLTKKTTIGKKTANIQLLYDILNNLEVPRPAPFVFRVGFTF